jgi:hypothetical protein
MGNRVYLTQEEVAERYRGLVSVGTLANWRAAGSGPPYRKIGKDVLYAETDLDAWDDRNSVKERRRERA